MSSAASSSSSSSSDSRPSSPHISRKRKRTTAVKDVASDDDSSGSDGSDSEVDDAHEDAVNGEDSDTPVLSHAEKRRQKKKQKGESKSAEEPAKASGKKSKSGDKSNSKPEIPQRQNSVWVGNLSYRTTPQSIRDFFKDVGEITRVHMPMKAAKGPGGTKENRGFAYVDFASPDAKVIAITLSEQELDGRRLLIKDGDDFTGRPTPASGPNAESPAAPGATTNIHSRTAQKILSSQKQPPGPTLFLGNLSFETTEKSIREMLEAHRPRSSDKEKDKPEESGWIRKVRLGTFEDSGHCKGWAFVDFTSTEHATAALTNPKNHHLDGRKIVVEYASPDAVRRGGGLALLGKKDKYSKEGREFKERIKETLPKRHHAKHAVDEGGDAEGADEDTAEPPPPKEKREKKSDPRKSGKDSRRDSTSRKVRAKPGAALAQAPRASATIVPSQGQKIKF